MPPCWCRFDFDPNTDFQLPSSLPETPVHQVNTKAWHKALEPVGIENFRWHDLRHTWASWHIQNVTPLHVLQELGGWSTPEMVQKYAHLSSDHLAQWVDRRPVVLAENSPEVVRFLLQEKNKGLSGIIAVGMFAPAWVAMLIFSGVFGGRK
jgi:hypothetical protein